MHGNNTLKYTWDGEWQEKEKKKKNTRRKKKRKGKKNMTPLTCHILRGEDTAEGSARGLLLPWTDLLCSVVRTKADQVTNGEADPLDWISFCYRANRPIASYGRYLLQ